MESKDGSSYSLPLFIIGLDKTEYLKDGFSNIFEDLSKKLADDKAAHFFLNWRESISEYADKTLAKIYSLVPDFENQEAKLSYVWYLLAANYSGKPIDGEKKYEGMYHDAYTRHTCSQGQGLLQTDKHSASKSRPGRPSIPAR